VAVRRRTPTAWCNAFDYNLSSNTTMYGRYALFNNNEFAGFINNSPYAVLILAKHRRTRTFCYSLTHIWGPRVVTETKVNFNACSLTSRSLLAADSTQPVLQRDFDPSVQGQPFCLPGFIPAPPPQRDPVRRSTERVAIWAVLWASAPESTNPLGAAVLYTMETTSAYENAVQGLEPEGTVRLRVVWKHAERQCGWFQ